MPSDDGERPNDLYARLGIRPFINCCGTRTVHGGSLMHPVVVAAMAEMACAFRRLRPPIPTDRDHLFRSIATSVARALAAPLDVDGDVSLPWVGQARQEPSR